MSTSDLLIIGAGVTGLTLAYNLRHTALKVRILEARKRIGGRTWSVHAADGAGPFDLGASWVWSNHPYVRRLAKELGIDLFPEFESGDRVIDGGPGIPVQHAVAPDNEQYTYRMTGGAQHLCARLAACLPDDIVMLDCPVRAIGEHEDHITVEATDRLFKARYVVVTLPPRLALHTLRYDPALPDDLKNAMAGTQTWMGRAMKVVVVYPRPFWRSSGLSGIGISFEGPVFRFHDASTADQSHAALFGWITEGDPIHTASPEERQEAVIAQLVRMFGPEARHPLSCLECDWAYEPFTAGPEDAGLPAGSTLYGHPLLQIPLMNSRLFFAGAETSPVHGGYLDGAVYSAEQTARKMPAGGL